MSDIYGGALNGVREYAKFHQQQNQLILNLEPAQASNDPLAVQRATVRIAAALDAITYAQGVAGIILKAIQLPN